MLKCPTCQEKMLEFFNMRDKCFLYICPKARVSRSPEFEGGRALYIKCDTVKFKEKSVKLFKEQLKSRLIKKPLPKEDYKRIEKGIKKLEQANVNDILYTLKSEEKTLKKQIETMVRESIDVSRQVENAYELYTRTFILQRFADKVGLEIGFPKDSKEFVKAVVKATVKQ